MKSNNISPKISVIIITYNQASLISRAINSVLIQKEWLFEIIICDDCSSDNTWEIINNYINDYPEYIKAYRNSSNLGIFGNFENTWSKPTGDFITFLSGDDELCDGLFKSTISFVTENYIDYKNNKICIYFDYITKWPNNMTYLHRNKIIKKNNFDPLSLKLRELISNRTTMFTKNLLSQFYSVNKEIGIYADGLLDIQIQLFAKNNYYIPIVGSIYYADIGISHRSTKEQHIKSIILFYNELRKIHQWRKKDINYIDYKVANAEFVLEKTIKKFFHVILFFLKGIDIKYGFTGLRIRHILFKLKSKLLTKIS
jgi:glycosyltransferase involved in cell wall biosynthesis